MKRFDNFRLVVGYLPEIDLLPETAQKAGLLKRVAAVLNLYEMPYSQFYWELVEAFVADSLHDSVAFEIDSERNPPAFASGGDAGICREAAKAVRSPLQSSRVFAPRQGDRLHQYRALGNGRRACAVS